MLSGKPVKNNPIMAPFIATINDISTGSGTKKLSYCTSMDYSTSTYEVLVPNLSGILSDLNLRKAILYAINHDEVVAVKNGLGGKAYTAMTMLKNDNDLIPDPSKVQEHLNNYYASLGK